MPVVRLGPLPPTPFSPWQLAQWLRKIFSPAARSASLDGELPGCPAAKLADASIALKPMHLFRVGFTAKKESIYLLPCRSSSAFLLGVETSSPQFCAGKPSRLLPRHALAEVRAKSSGDNGSRPGSNSPPPRWCDATARRARSVRGCARARSSPG